MRGRPAVLVACLLARLAPAAEPNVGTRVEAAHQARLRGDFAEAVRLLDDVRKNDSDPRHNYNLGRVYQGWAAAATTREDESARLERAINGYTEFLASEDTDQELRETARRYRDQASARLDTIRRQPATGVVTSAAPIGESSTWRKPVGWTALGVGAAALGLGIAMGVRAAGKADDLEESEDSQQPFDPDLESSGEFAEKLQIVGLSVGGALCALGATLLILDGMDQGARVPVAGARGFTVRF